MVYLNIKQKKNLLYKNNCEANNEICNNTFLYYTVPSKYLHVPLVHPNNNKHSFHTFLLDEHVL
jgi:hypothetical protein